MAGWLIIGKALAEEYQMASFEQEKDQRLS